MASDRDRVRVALDVNAAGVGGDTSPRASASTPFDRDIFRIALLGDFSGRASRGEGVAVASTLASRGPVRIDRDSLDDAFARLEPHLELTIPNSPTPVDVRFASLEDFHPDRLYERLPILRVPRDPGPGNSTSGAPPRASSTRVPNATPANVLDAILGDTPLPPGGASLARAPAGIDEGNQDESLSAFVRRVVAPHVVDERDGGSGARPTELAATTAALRELLHHPAFQELEALWRGADLLTRRLETDERLQLYLVDLSRLELAAALLENTEERALHRLLGAQSASASGGEPWSLLVACYSFGGGAGDVELLARLSAVGASLGASVVAAADAVLAGSSSFATTPDPDDWSDAVPSGWNELRASDDARFLGLVLPRLLLRLPYGERTDPCDVVRFEEVPDGGRLAHQDYLWGNGAFVVALLLGQAAGGRPGREVGGLPFHLTRVDGDVSAKPCAEVILSQRNAERLLERGLMPLMSVKDGDAVVLPRLQSVAAPLAPLAGRAAGVVAKGSRA